MNTPAANSLHFPEDATWQKHCQMIAAYRAAQLEVNGLANRLTAALESVERHADREAA